MSDTIVDKVTNILREGEDTFRVSTMTGRECCVIGGRNFGVNVGDLVIYRLTNPTISPAVVAPDSAVGDPLILVGYSGNQQQYHHAKSGVTFVSGSFYAPVKRS